MSNVATTGNPFSEAMVERYAVLHRLELNASTREGILQTLSAWARGEGNPDSRLTDSPETREVFAPLRHAYFVANGMAVDPAYSNVSFFDPDPIVQTTDGLPPHSEPAPTGEAPSPATSE